jgi:tRNA G46 methylase TrmB
LFSDVFTDQAARALQLGGELHAWTDVADYFAVMQALLDHDPRYERLPPPAEHTPAHDLDYHTSFERNLRKAGRTIHRGRWRRVDAG